MEPEILNEEFEEKPSKIKKVYTLMIGIFLVLLIISYVLVPGNVFNFIAGWFESDTIKDNEINIDENTVLVFNNESLETLKGLYDQNIGVEFKVCLKGIKINNVYYIEETIQPRTFSQEYNRVVAEPCNREDLVSLHTHPFRQCLPSNVDVTNFEKFRKDNPEALLAIMCEKDRINFYR